MRSLIFDTSPLSHFAKAGELETLARLTEGDDRFVTEAVLGELSRGAGLHPQLSAFHDVDWLVPVRVDGLAELTAFAEYARVLGSGPRNVGEAATLAWAEVNGGVAIIDERAGTRCARERGLKAHGTLWLAAEGYRSGVLSEVRAEMLITNLGDTEAWFPSMPSGFLSWARGEGLV